MTSTTYRANGLTFATMSLLLGLTGGCGGETVPPAPYELCCPEFVVGADMSRVDFGTDTSVEGSYHALAQAAGDVAGIATMTRESVTSSCRNIANDLHTTAANDGGIDSGPLDEDPNIRGQSGADLATAWCGLAVAEIRSNLHPPIAALGEVARNRCGGP